jgi:hypothetical protein
MEQGGGPGIGRLMSDKAETCFVLPLREAVAHLPVGIRDPRIQRWVVLPMAILIRALTWSYTSEQGFSQFSASMADSFLSKILASSPRRPSVDTTNGEICRRCSRQQAPRCCFFF